MMSFEELVRLSIKESPLAQPLSSLSEKVLFVIESKKRLYAFIKLVIYSFFTAASLIACVVIWQMERSNIFNSEAANLLVLLFSDFALVTKYWQDYAVSILESLPVVSVIIVAAFAWAACVSLWMTVRAYLMFIHRTVKHV